MRHLVLLLFAGVACTTSEPQEVVEGQRLYLQHGCAICHGPDGRGDGPLARNLDPKPRDFRDEGAYNKGRDAGAISLTIEQGTRIDGGAMPGYPHIPSKDREMIAAYVVSLQGRISHRAHREKGQLRIQVPH